MPCYEPDAHYYAQFEADEKRRKEYEDKVNSLTRMLCTLLKNVEPLPKKKVGSKGFWPNPFSEGRNGGYLETTVDEETMQWWDKHKKDDAKRLQSRVKKPSKRKRV